MHPGRVKTLVTPVVLTLLMLAAPLPARASSAEVEELVNRGNDLRRAGDDRGALPLLAKAYERAPTPRNAVQLGLVEHALGRWAESDRHLSEAMKVKPGQDSWIDHNRATIVHALNQAKSHVNRSQLAEARRPPPSSDSALRIWAERTAWLGMAGGVGFGTYQILGHNRDVKAFNELGCFESEAGPYLEGGSGGADDLACTTLADRYARSRKLAMTGFITAGAFAATGILLRLLAPDEPARDLRAAGCAPRIGGLGLVCASTF